MIHADIHGRARPSIEQYKLPDFSNFASTRGFPARRVILSNCGSAYIKPCSYLEGLMGDLVSRLIMGIVGVAIWVTGIINLLTKSP